MDHQAFAQLLGNCVEFLGAVAVIATLGYLAIRFGKLLLLQDPCSVFIFYFIEIKPG